jgi:hypothetical protein
MSFPSPGGSGAFSRLQHVRGAPVLLGARCVEHAVIYYLAVTASKTLSRRWFAWLTPRIALAATVVVALLLLLPIRTFGPGDHEKESCGNALRLNLDPWIGGDPADGYWEKARRACTAQRVDRLAESAAVMTITILAVTVTAAARRATVSVRRSGSR